VIKLKVIAPFNLRPVAHPRAAGFSLGRTFTLIFLADGDPYNSAWSRADCDLKTTRLEYLVAIKIKTIAPKEGGSAP